jgi:hypothetical protein
MPLGVNRRTITAFGVRVQMELPKILDNNTSPNYLKAK